MNDTLTVCVLGATGRIGIELAANLLALGIKVNAVIRNKEKFLRMLQERKVETNAEILTIYEIDLFQESPETNQKINQSLKGCAFICNAASPKISWIPLSKVNRTWSYPVSGITKKIVNSYSDDEICPHLFVFCGPDYFTNYDKNIRLYQKITSKISRIIFPALQDNYLESLFLLDGFFNVWTVFRCGSIREGNGELGNASNVQIDFEKDGSNYRLGKGCSLQASDLGTYLAKLISSKSMGHLDKKMPYIFNTSFE